MKHSVNGGNVMPEGLDLTMTSLLQLTNSFSEKGWNTIPFKGSWTAAQVTDHITKSNKSIAQALDLEGKHIDRRPDERTPELAKIFLDFSTRLKSPDFILPAQETYGKASLIAALESSLGKLKETAVITDLQEAIEHPAFGEITKMELLYFVLYHTQRHIRQLQHIYEIVENRQYKLLSFLFMQPISFF